MKFFTENDALFVKNTVDAGIKNKWNWQWIADTVTLDFPKIGSKTLKFSQFFKKGDVPGKARCTVCNTDINYSARGKVALKCHSMNGAHKQTDYRDNQTDILIYNNISN